MPKKTANSTTLMTTLARGVGSAVGRIANTAQRLAAVSSEAVKGASAPGKKKTTRSKPRKASRKKTGKPKATPQAKTRKKSAPAKA